jgi:acyl carrier protein
MTRREFLTELETLMELPPGSLKGDEPLSSLAPWDSMGVLGFVLLVEEKLGHVVEGSAVAEAKTIADLLALVETHLDG